MRLFLVALIAMFFLSCQHDSEKVEISPVRFIRFDEDLKSFDVNRFEYSDSIMYAKYGDLYTFYIEGLMGLGVQRPSSDPNYYKSAMGDFMRAEYMPRMDSCEKYVIKDLPSIEKQLTESYGNLKYHFPYKNPSRVFSFFVSPLGANPQAAFSYGKDTIGINWFSYLGRDFPLYPVVYEGYTYTIEWNSKEYIPRNVMLVEYNLLKEINKEHSESNEVIYQMIEEGKKYYYLDKVCPFLKDHTKIGYTEAQLKWCQENEYDIWAFLKENKLLYSVDAMDAKRLTDIGPTTPGMPTESPGMVGSWVGWQMVRAFAEKNKTSLSEIISLSPKDIFKGINYKPNKK